MGNRLILRTGYTHNSTDSELLQSGENKFRVLKWDSTMVVHCKKIMSDDYQVCDFTALKAF